MLAGELVRDNPCKDQYTREKADNEYHSISSRHAEY